MTPTPEMTEAARKAYDAAALQPGDAPMKAAITAALALQKPAVPEDIAGLINDLLKYPALNCDRAAAALRSLTARVPEDIAGLIARLRERARGRYARDGDFEEAAATISSLAQEKTEWQAAAYAKTMEKADLLARIRELESKLPEGMKHCTIRFKECEKGHGRLTADNWIDNGCPWCRIREFEAEREEWGDLVKSTVADQQRISELEAERDVLMGRVSDFDVDRSETLMIAQSLQQDQIDSIRNKTIEECAEEALWFLNVEKFTAKAVANRIRALAKKAE